MTELKGMNVYTKDELTLVTFEDTGYLGGHSFMGQAAERLEGIVETHDSKLLVLDLKEITALPSYLLGVLVSLKNRGVEIRLFNVTVDVRLILETMNLDTHFDLRDGDLSALIAESEKQS